MLTYQFSLLEQLQRTQNPVCEPYQAPSFVHQSSSRDKGQQGVDEIVAVQKTRANPAFVLGRLLRDGYDSIKGRQSPVEQAVRESEIEALNKTFEKSLEFCVEDEQWLTPMAKALSLGDDHAFLRFMARGILPSIDELLQAVQHKGSHPFSIILQRCSSRQLKSIFQAVSSDRNRASLKQLMDLVGAHLTHDEALKMLRLSDQLNEDHDESVAMIEKNIAHKFKASYNYKDRGSNGYFYAQRRLERIKRLGSSLENQQDLSPMMAALRTGKGRAFMSLVAKDIFPSIDELLQTVQQNGPYPFFMVLRYCPTQQLVSIFQEASSDKNKASFNQLMDLVGDLLTDEETQKMFRVALQLSDKKSAAMIQKFAVKKLKINDGLLDGQHFDTYGEVKYFDQSFVRALTRGERQYAVDMMSQKLEESGKDKALISFYYEMILEMEGDADILIELLKVASPEDVKMYYSDLEFIIDKMQDPDACVQYIMDHKFLSRVNMPSFSEEEEEKIWLAHDKEERTRLLISAAAKKVDEQIFDCLYDSFGHDITSGILMKYVERRYPNSRSSLELLNAYYDSFPNYDPRKYIHPSYLNALPAGIFSGLVGAYFIRNPAILFGLTQRGDDSDMKYISTPKCNGFLRNTQGR